MTEIIICIASGALVACLISIAIDIREINKILNEWGEEDDQL